MLFAQGPSVVGLCFVPMLLVTVAMFMYANSHFPHCYFVTMNLPMRRAFTSSRRHLQRLTP
jgi:hypothetical protein